MKNNIISLAIVNYIINRRNRRTSDDPQDNQHDKQTCSATLLFKMGKGQARLLEPLLRYRVVRVRAGGINPPPFKIRLVLPSTSGDKAVWQVLAIHLPVYSQLTIVKAISFNVSFSTPR
jgi:hypothetical protein